MGYSNISNICSQQVAGPELLDLRNDDLIALKILRLGHRKRLIKLISELKHRKNGNSQGLESARADVH